MNVVRTWYSPGGVSPAEVVVRAQKAGLSWLALADDGLYGAVEFWKACKAAGIKPILGARVGGRLHLVCNRTGYANLCRILSAPAHEDVTGLRILEGDPGPEIVEECDWEFLPAPKVFPHVPDAANRLRELCRAGMAVKYPADPPWERLDLELEVINRLGYAGYFLVVQDIVRHSRERGVPVAGRGSGASSLAAYVLGITNVCPVTYGLPFERFLHEGRTDYPDLDIDFCWKIRDDIIAYVFGRWPDSAMVSTHIRFQPRSAFREVAREAGYSDEQISNREIEPGDLEHLRAKARLLIGAPRHLSVHPGGVVLGVDGVAPVERAAKGVLVTQYDKDSVEEAGLVKIDLLGNRALSTLRETVEIVERTEGVRIDVERLPGDEATVRLLAEGRTLGCNQLESPAMRALLRMMRPRDVRGLMQALALIRPGASSGGMKERFIRRVRGLEASPPGGLLADTHGIMLYEDDAMLVAAALAGLSLAEGDRFRRRVQKLATDEERLAVSKEFLGLCARRGVPAELAQDVWVQMAKFNEFSFCRAHAASYAVLAWASAWLAAHHPAAHWTAALNNNQGLYDARVYVEQAKREGIRVLLPCVQKSAPGYSEEGGAIRVGLGRIAGLEEREIESILSARPFESFVDFLVRAKVSQPSLRSLILCGAFDWTGVSRPRLFVSARAHGLEAPPIPDFPEAEKFSYEYGVLGLSARRHPISHLLGPRPLDSRALKDHVGRKIRLAGLVATWRTAATARGEAMGFMTMEDEHGLFEVALFPQAYRRCRALLDGAGPYLVEGIVEERYDVVTLRAVNISLPVFRFGCMIPP